jgi:hypothetical protein
MGRLNAISQKGRDFGVLLGSTARLHCWTASQGRRVNRKIVERGRQAPDPVGQGDQQDPVKDVDRARRCTPSMIEPDNRISAPANRRAVDLGSPATGGIGSPNGPNFVIALCDPRFIVPIG